MTNDTTPPKRIWVRWPQPTGTGLAFSCQSRPPELRTEYTLASEADAMVAAALREQEQNYLHLHNAAFDVWRWFETARPDLIGPRAEKLRDALMGPRPYGTADQPAAAALDKLIAGAEARGRIKGLDEARSIAGLNAWMHVGDDARSQGMDAGARHQSKVIHDALSEAIRAAKGEAK